VDFYQPRGGEVRSGNATGSPMKFEFSGDDDVWVFIDDVLVLDLGGTHGIVSGSIDFSTGEVLQYLDWQGTNSTSEERTQGTMTSFPTTIRECFERAGMADAVEWNAEGTTFADYSEHKLTFFYMERAAVASNCKLNFNLQTIPEESLTVRKTVEIDIDEKSAIQDYIDDSISYKFRVMKVNNDGTVSDRLFIEEGTSYTLEDGTVGYVGKDGIFELKTGQSAQFKNLLGMGNGSKYVVQELLPVSYDAQYGSVTYSIGSTEILLTSVTSGDYKIYQSPIFNADVSQSIHYKNKVDTSKLSLLKVEKKIKPGSIFANNQKFTMQVKLGDELLPKGTTYTIGNTEYTVETDGQIVLRDGENAIINVWILAGTTYEVKELGATENGWRTSYTGSATVNGTESALNFTDDKTLADGIFQPNSEVLVTVHNATYDFVAKVPISKRFVGNDSEAEATFTFNVEQVDENGDAITGATELPGTTLTVVGENVASGNWLLVSKIH